MARGDNSFKGGGITAKTTVMAQAVRAMESAVNRPSYLPGFVGVYGPAGYGKSIAAAFVAAQFDAYHVEVRDSWKRSDFLRQLLRVMRVAAPQKRIADMMDQAAEQLALSGRPLIIDEADKPVDHGYIEVIRDLHEGAGGHPILLIGEEQLETKLRRYERMHSRVKEWVPAQPASLRDVTELSKLYCAGLFVADDLLDHVRTATGGNTRLICINLARVSEWAAQQRDLKGCEIDLNLWGSRELYTGEARRGSAG